MKPIVFADPALLDEAIGARLVPISVDGRETKFCKWGFTGGAVTMYAVIESGGKQHRVKEGETLKLEKIEVATGETVDFDKVLLVGEGDSVKIGRPYVDGGKVSAEVLAHGRGDKVTIIKFRRRKHHMKRAGHRQWYTEVKITGISA